MKYLLIAVCLLAGCSDKETDAEYNARLRAEDVKLADGTIAVIGEIPKAPANNNNLANHPLSRFFVPHGYEALNHIGKFWRICDKTHTAYTAATCDEAIERGIRVGQSVGIELARDDLDNRDYWVKHQSLFEAVKRHEENYFASLPKKPTLTQMNTYAKTFREKSAALMAGMSD